MLTRPALTRITGLCTRRPCSITLPRPRRVTITPALTQQTLQPGIPNCSFHTSTMLPGSKLRPADRLKGAETSVWVTFGKLAADEKALNLGQGFPDFAPPNYVGQSLRETSAREDFGMFQYTRGFGHPRLVKALATLYSPLIGQDINAMDNILISVGAYGSLFYCAQGLLNPGDEAIIIEPFFDCYLPMVTVAGATPVFVPLRPTKKTGPGSTSGDWKFDPDELASKFNDKTKMLFFNNPNNPLGKVFTREEMTLVADLCKKHDVICVSDEVYEWMVYEPNTFIRMASLPGMWERTLTIGSAGKTFSSTGWKIGWAIGPDYLIRALQMVHQNCIYTSPTPIQEAVAIAFETELARLSKPDCYFNSLKEELIPKMDRMADMLRDIGMHPIMPEGGYFMMVDFSNIEAPFDPNSPDTKDVQFARWMTKVKKIAAIPPSVFYGPDNRSTVENMIRFCFIKEDSTLDKAEEMFKLWKSSS